MEDLKEMFAQMMTFQMEFQQKYEEKLLQLQKENEERIQKKKKKKNEEKQQRFFFELLKQQEALFKSLNNNQPTDCTTIFSQNAVWNALETFSYAPVENKSFEAYYRRYEDIYITDCASWTDAKNSPATSTIARNCGTQQVRRLYLTKKTLRTWLFKTFKLLSELFSSKTSLFHKRWKCLNLTERDSDDYLGFASVVHKNCNDFI